MFLSAFIITDQGARVVPADLFALVLIALSIVLAVKNGLVSVSKMYLAFVPILVMFALSNIFAQNQFKAWFEFLIILFSFVNAVCITYLLSKLSDKQFENFCRGYFWILLVLGTVFLLDFFVFPSLVGGPNLNGGLTGTFNNTGQAGSYLSVHLVLCLALMFSGLGPKSIIYKIVIFILLVCLVFTVKRASMVGLVIGIALLTLQFLLSSSKKEKLFAVYVILSAAILIAVGLFAFGWAFENIDGVSRRFDRKINANSVSDFTDGFFGDNLKAMMAAFMHNPVIGVGQANVNGRFFDYEIHSTYMKIVATAGILGSLAYTYFAFSFLRRLWSVRAMKLASQYSAFLYYVLPFYLGLFVSWGYTYHLRKREFWLLFAITVFCYMRFELKKLQTKNELKEMS